MTVQVTGWKPGIHATLGRNLLQLSLAGSWFPAEGVDVLRVPPGERFRVWIAPALYYREADLQRTLADRITGALILQINGREHEAAF
jgi:hypothetical protein